MVGDSIVPYRGRNPVNLNSRQRELLKKELQASFDGDGHASSPKKNHSLIVYLINRRQQKTCFGRFFYGNFSVGTEFCYSSGIVLNKDWEKLSTSTHWNLGCRRTHGAYSDSSSTTNRLPTGSSC